MDFLASFLIPKPDGPGPKRDLILYPGDLKEVLKVGALGAAAASAYFMSMKVANRRIDPCIDLIDKPENFNLDPIIRANFVKLQAYRDLDTHLFKSAIANVDRLLLLEHVLASKQVKPAREDKYLATTNFKMAYMRMSELQLLAQENLSPSHVKTVDLFIKPIFAQLQKHYSNVLAFCTEYNPSDCMEQAPEDIAKAMIAYQKRTRSENKQRQHRRWEDAKHGRHRNNN
jgi:hypothetical protein